MTQKFAVGQRVRINEQDEPVKHVGKMATVERLETNPDGISTCVVKVDWEDERLLLPDRYLEPIHVKPSSLLANDLFLPWDVDVPTARLSAYTSDNAIAGRLLETLLFYDRVVIPTVDFAVVAPLVHWLGVGILRDLLVSEALSFVRYRGGLGYLGNGNGLALFEILPGESKKDEWWARAARSSPSEATYLQIHHRLQGLDDRLVKDLALLVEICTAESALPEFTKKVEEETYKDIIRSTEFSQAIVVRVGGPAHLKRLPGVNANQIRVFSSLTKPAVAGDPIDLVLRLAMLNLEAYLAEEAAARDMVTDRGFSRLLQAKLERYTSGGKSHESFSSLLAVNRIPDIVQSVSSGLITPTRLWDFRNTRVARQFREWFDKLGPESPSNLLQEYTTTLRAGSNWNGGPLKTIRFMVVQGITAALSLVPGVGMLASLGINTADSFLVEKLRFGFRPRYFIDDLHHRFFNDRQ